MKIALLVSLFAVSLLTFFPDIVSGQDKEAPFSDLPKYLSASRFATGRSPFRDRKVVEIADDPAGPWRSYSSMISEVIPPDRSHLTYTSGRTGEFIHIGKVSFSKGLDGKWTESTDVIFGTVANPAGDAPPWLKSAGRIEVSESSGNNAGSTTITNRKVDTSGKLVSVHTYRFDSNNILVETTNIGYNGYNWVRHTDTFEYDSSIVIKSPVE